MVGTSHSSSWPHHLRQEVRRTLGTLLQICGPGREWDGAGDTGGAVAERSSTPTFVGRSAELAIYEGAVNNARDGLPSMLLVRGDAGIGKSRFIAEGARRSQVPLYLGRC